MSAWGVLRDHRFSGFPQNLRLTGLNMGIASPKPTVALIVEDEFLVRMLAVDIFTDYGFETVEAGNADEAILILESRGDIDVIFTDINMPGSIDGLGLASIVSQRWPFIRILVTSALRIPGNRPLPRGSMFLAKPYQSSQIVGAVQALTKSPAWNAL